MTPGRQNDNDLHISSILIGPLNPQNGLLAQKKYKFLVLGIAAAPVDVCQTSFLKFPNPTESLRVRIWVDGTNRRKYRIDFMRILHAPSCGGMRA